MIKALDNGMTNALDVMARYEARIKALREVLEKFARATQENMGPAFIRMARYALDADDEAVK